MLADARGTYRARTYIAMPAPGAPRPGLPSAGYLKQLIDGPSRTGLPADYLAMLRSRADAAIERARRRG